MNSDFKKCITCGQAKPFSLFYKGLNQCKACTIIYMAKWRKAHPEQVKEWARGFCDRHGGKPISESKASPGYLGVWVAERALSKFFNHIERMPFNNPGYDFRCGLGKKIDVKSACERPTRSHNNRWMFNIFQNKIADFFPSVGL